MDGGSDEGDDYWDLVCRLMGARPFTVSPDYSSLCPFFQLILHSSLP